MLILGITGVGLAAAMFFDSAYPSEPLQKPPQKRAAQKAAAVPSPVNEGLPAPPPVKAAVPVVEKANVSRTPTKPRSKHRSRDRSETKHQESETVDYTELYRQELAKQKKAKEQEIIDAINSNAYTGVGDTASRRLYLQQQAYKWSREQTPVIPMQQVLGAHEDEDEDELVEVLDRMEQEENKKKVKVSKEAWEARDQVLHTI